MKKLIAFFGIALIFTSCEKVENDINNNCTSNCTTLSGKFVSLNNEPVANIKVSLNYRISGGELGGGSTRKIVNIKSDKNGNFSKDFFIKDSELGKMGKGYFEINIDDSNIDVDKYIRKNNLIGTTTVSLGSAIYSIMNRDTIINIDYYVPKKAYIKVNLNNFVPQQADDYFEVQTLYPFGGNNGENNTFLDSPYSTGFSGYGSFRANAKNTLLKVFVAEGEKNIIRIFRRKKGVNTYEDFPMIIPPNNSIELTYEY
jgi:hypothetical protein